MKILWFFKKNISRNIKQTAYHEAGHTVFAYFVGWKVNEVKLEKQDGFNYHGSTSYNFIEDTRLVHALFNRQLLNELTNSERNYLGTVAIKRCTSLIGGPIAEAYFQNGIDFKGALPISFSGPDMRMSYEIESLMLRFGVENFIEEQLKELAIVAKDKILWRSIIEIASALYKNKEYKLNSDEVEKIIKKTGLTDFLEKFQS